MSQVFSSLSAQETYRMHGKVTRAQLEELLDLEHRIDKIDGIDSYMHEAMGQFPAEDFLETIKTRLHELSKKLRGDNKATANGIIEALDDLAQCTFYAADYGRSELNKAIKAIEGVQQ